MIHSMTGFGEGRAERHGVEATVEMRSVNKRFMEVSIRMPRSLSGREAKVEARVKKAFERGRFNVQVKVEQAADEVLPIEVDPEAARGYTRLLEELRSAAGLNDSVRLEHLLTFSDVFTSVEEEEAVGEDAWPAIEAALEEAIEALRIMRREEGRALQQDLEARAAAIEEELEAVERQAPERIERRRAQLKERIDDLFGDERIAEERLEAEIALLADKLDITEECVRLRSHLDQFRQTLASDEPAGRKLKFLVQEIHREVNTIGSKANDAAISHRAVQMKEEVERIREQVQNVE